MQRLQVPSLLPAALVDFVILMADKYLNNSPFRNEKWQLHIQDLKHLQQRTNDQQILVSLFKLLSAKFAFLLMKGFQIK